MKGAGDHHGEMLALQRDMYAKGIGVPLLILGGAGEPDLPALHTANPLSEIAYRPMHDFGGGIYDYRPGGGWRSATRADGRAFAKWTWDTFIGGRGADFVGAIKYITCHNEPIDELGIGAETEPGFVAWTHGTLDFFESVGKQATVGNWSAGLDALKGDPRKDVWKRQDMVDLFGRCMDKHHVVNFHQGAILGEANLVQPFDSLRHRAIRTTYMSVAPELAKLQLVSTEFYTYHVRGLTPEQWQSQLDGLLVELVKDIEFWRWITLWTDGTPSGLTTDMWYGDDWGEGFMPTFRWAVEKAFSLQPK